MKYYYDGCPSWKWYYPFHYAPFASDLRNIERFRKYCVFELGAPFRPVEQLMAVLPEDSSHALPEACRWLMSDPKSPIIDFYPKEILCDSNGKAMPWLWVVLLPFIDEKRLLAALKPTMSRWTENEILCNVRGPQDGYIFLHSSHNLALLLSSEKLINGALTLDQYCERKVFGKIHRLDRIKDVPAGETMAILTGTDSELSESIFNPINFNSATCAIFVEPPKLTHMSVLLKGVAQLAPVLTDDDKRIRRPRLNGRGGTIANLGFVAQQQSHQVGYGSMNISSYERELADRTGRGNQMNQTGIRSWGSMEPVQKKYPLSKPAPSHIQAHNKNPFIPMPHINQNGVPQGRLVVPTQSSYSRWVPSVHNNIQLQHAPPPPPPPPPPRSATATASQTYHSQPSIIQSPHSNYSYSQRMNAPYSHRVNSSLDQHQRHHGNPPLRYPPQRYNHHATTEQSNNLNQTETRTVESGKVSASKLHSLRAQLAKTLQQNQRGST